jgi:hypothetical protein
MITVHTSLQKLIDRSKDDDNISIQRYQYSSQLLDFHLFSRSSNKIIDLPVKRVLKVSALINNSREKECVRTVEEKYRGQFHLNYFSRSSSDSSDCDNNILPTKNVISQDSGERDRVDYLIDLTSRAAKQRRQEAKAVISGNIKEKEDFYFESPMRHNR